MCGILVWIEEVPCIEWVGCAEVFGKSLNGTIPSIDTRDLDTTKEDEEDNRITSTIKYEDFLPGIHKRGPDSCTTYRYNCHDTNRDSVFPKIKATGSVLQLRGKSPVESPLVDKKTGDFLLWNGEIFGGDITVAPGMNDSQMVFDELVRVEEERIASILSCLRGPFAFVFWKASSRTLWFGKDPFGRRSLLAQFSKESGTFALTSVVPVNLKYLPFGFIEIPPGVYKMSFRSSSEPVNVERVPWAPGTLEMTGFRRHEMGLEPRCLDVKFAAAGLKSMQHAAMLRVLEALRLSISVRCNSIDMNDRNLMQKSMQHGLEYGENPARILILFSGGVDSTLIAALAHEAISPDEPIDLINICFGDGSSPDRIAAIDALCELQQAYPTRLWRLVGVDKKMSDVEESRKYLIRLLAPSDTLMDQNIGAALWFAAEGQGYLLASSSNESLKERRTFRSSARVVLLGHGADELFGGYSRHRTRFRKGGWSGLAEELDLDFSRLWIRNLGRDDRLVADRSREARHPFLAEEVVAVALEHSMIELMDFSLPPGHGDKQILRECLRHLGLPRASERVKRALQFGSRLAKAANVAYFGGTRQANNHKAGKVRIQDAMG